eukprot:16291686-Heterocapsa_arctica.AAC.1
MGGHQQGRRAQTGRPMQMGRQGDQSVRGHQHVRGDANAGDPEPPHDEGCARPDVEARAAAQGQLPR